MGKLIELNLIQKIILNIGVIILLTFVGRYSPININPVIYVSIITFILMYFYGSQIKIIEKSRKFYLVITLIILLYIILYYFFNHIWYGFIKTYVTSKAYSSNFTYFHYGLIITSSDIIFNMANVGMLFIIYAVFLKLTKLKINKVKAIKFSSIYFFSCIALTLVYMFIVMKLLIKVDRSMFNIIMKVDSITGFLFKVLFIYIYFFIISKIAVDNEHMISEGAEL